MFDFLLHLDKELLLAINQQHSVFLDYLMVFASAKLTWLPLYLFLAYLIVKRFKWQSALVFVMIALTIAIADQSSVHLFKETFLRLRPCHQPDLTELIRTIKGCGGQYGFVSSHATNSAALVAFLFMVLKPVNRWLATLLIIYVLLIMYSRVYLGVHFPADVLAGAALGICCGLLTGWLFRVIKSRI
ncbi:MAG: phosphatase PAP2 family protein [Bacteroidetes bacterium]|jgi:undecaprenyl-diphosphatase|nr:phosphatase PAP2 family protein [Bacteroidota bacterium]